MRNETPGDIVVEEFDKEETIKGILVETEK